MMIRGNKPTARELSSSTRSIDIENDNGINKRGKKSTGSKRPSQAGKKSPSGSARRRRYRPGQKALREIVKYQEST